MGPQYWCPFCGLYLTSRSEIWAHVRYDHDHQVLPCPMESCDAIIKPDYKEFCDHMCGKTPNAQHSFSETDISRLEFTKHGERTKPEFKIPSYGIGLPPKEDPNGSPAHYGANNHRCLFLCGATIRGAGNMDIHLKDKHDGESMFCPLAGCFWDRKVRRYESWSRYHMGKVHKIQSSELPHLALFKNGKKPNDRFRLKLAALVNQKDAPSWAADLQTAIETTALSEYQDLKAAPSVREPAGASTRNHGLTEETISTGPTSREDSAGEFVASNGLPSNQNCTLSLLPGGISAVLNECGLVGGPSITQASNINDSSVPEPLSGKDPSSIIEIPRLIRATTTSEPPWAEDVLPEACSTKEFVQEVNRILFSERPVNASFRNDSPDLPRHGLGSSLNALPIPISHELVLRQGSQQPVDLSVGHSRHSNRPDHAIAQSDEYVQNSLQNAVSMRALNPGLSESFDAPSSTSRRPLSNPNPSLQGNETELAIYDQGNENTFDSSSKFYRIDQSSQGQNELSSPMSFTNVAPLPSTNPHLPNNYHLSGLSTPVSVSQYGSVGDSGPVYSAKHGQVAGSSAQIPDNGGCNGQFSQPLAFSPVIPPLAAQPSALSGLVFPQTPSQGTLPPLGIAPENNNANSNAGEVYTNFGHLNALPNEDCQNAQNRGFSDSTSNFSIRIDPPRCVVEIEHNIFTELIASLEGRKLSFDCE